MEETADELARLLDQLHTTGRPLLRILAVLDGRGRQGACRDSTLLLPAGKPMWETWRRPAIRSLTLRLAICEGLDAMEDRGPHTAGEGAGADSGPAVAASPPVIMSNKPGSFAWGVLANRHPALIQQVRAAFPYSRRQHEALDDLLDEITNGAVEPLDPEDHYHEHWADSGREHFGRSWYDVPFLWAESYFYRRLLGAVGYFGNGPWQGVDPFAPFKQAELCGEAVGEELRALDALADAPADERATVLLHASLWGNRDSGGEGATSVHAAGSVWSCREQPGPLNPYQECVETGGTGRWVTLTS